MQYSASVWIHIRKSKHKPNSTVLVLLKDLCTLDVKPRRAAKWWDCAEIHALCTKYCFPDTKVWIAQNIHNSVSCTLVSIKHSLRGKKKKNPKCDFFSLLSVPVCRTRPTKIRISVSKVHSNLRIMDKKGRFYDTPKEIVQNMHRFASGSIGQIMLYSSAHAARKRKASWKGRLRYYLRVSAQKASNQDGLIRDPTVTKVTH